MSIVNQAATRQQQINRMKNQPVASKSKILSTATLTFLDLGCGSNKIDKKGLHDNALIPTMDSNVKILGVDLNKTDQVDVHHDLTSFPYPFQNDSIDGVFSSHFIEHLDGPQRILFFDEMYRIMKVGAKMRLIHPYFKSDRAVQDPTHKWPPITENSYWYWNRNWREQNKLTHYLGKCNFNFNMWYLWASPEWGQKSEEARNFAILHYFNVVADLVVDLIKEP